MMRKWFRESGTRAAWHIMVLAGLTCIGQSVCASGLLARYEGYLAGHKGDPVQGELLFAQENRAGCIRCHSTDGSKTGVGPSLAGIGDKYDIKGLIESVLLPSKSLMPGYRTLVLQTDDDEELTGILWDTTPATLELVTADGQRRVLNRAFVNSMRSSEVSIMPEGLLDSLTPEEVSHLFAYLQGLRASDLNLLKSTGAPAQVEAAQNPIGIRRLNRPEHDFDKPVWLGPHPTIPNMLVILEHRRARVWMLSQAGSDQEQKRLFADLSHEVSDGPWEGLMSIAFHPQFADNKRYFLKHETLEQGKRYTMIVEKRASENLQQDSGMFAQTLVKVEQPADNHNGGSMAFGPDGYLYFAMGDGGPQEDPHGRSQNLSDWMGKLHRIDVNRSMAGAPYGIPEDNPFVGVAESRPEIWAIGFREPWRFSFDRETGDLWLGDVGQNRFEEVAIVRKGENHGWNVFEGFETFSEKYRRPGTVYTPPVVSFNRRLGVSITGGYVYRANPKSSFYGIYICGDFESRRIWGIRQENGELKKILEIGRAPAKIASFGTDHKGELYLVGYDGVIYALDLAEATF